MVQPGINPETRTYSDYESVNECMEGVCKIYEEHLKRRNPNTPTITYDISQLFDFVDQVGAPHRANYANSSSITHFNANGTKPYICSQNITYTIYFLLVALSYLSKVYQNCQYP